MWTLQCPFRHFYATHTVVRDVVLIHGCSHDLLKAVFEPRRKYGPLIPTLTYGKVMTYRLRISLLDFGR